MHIVLAASALLSCACALTAQAQAWRPLGLPTPWMIDAIVSDPIRQRLVTVDPNGTFEFDGATWTRRPVDGPPPRSGAAIAYDRANGRLVLFGGWDLVGWRNDTWTWDGIAWRQETPANVPSPRGVAVACFAAQPAPRVLLFGGSLPLPSPPSNETWSWDGSNWQLVDPGSGTAARPAPGSRIAHDAGRGVTVALSWTMNGLQQFLWNGTAWQALGAPNLPDVSALYFDAARTALIAFDSSWTEHVWTGAGPTWTAGAAARPSPNARLQSAAFDDSAGRAAVLWLEGSAIGLTRCTTSSWDGRQWTHLWNSDDAHTGDIDDLAMAYDPVRARTVLVAGGFSGPLPVEVWEFDGTAYARIPTVSGPLQRQGQSMAFSGVGSTGCLLFGGFDGAMLADTWLWNGTAWSPLAPQNIPPARDGAAMSFDAVRGRVVLFGGRDAGFQRLADTWEWTGSDWTRVHQSGPARAWHRLAFRSSPQSNRTVLFGGEDGTGWRNDTWEWDGLSWQQVPTPVSPPALTWFSMASEGARVRVFGGLAVNGLQDSWEYDGATWTLLGSMPAGSGPVVHDGRRGHYVAHLHGVTWLHGNVATGALFGAGCGVPRVGLGSFGVPSLGNRRFAWDLRSEVAGVQAAVLAVSTVRTSTPIGPCTLLVGAGASLVVFTNPGGFASVRLAVPANPSLLGLDVFAQAGVLAATPPGFALSNGCQARIAW